MISRINDFFIGRALAQTPQNNVTGSTFFDLFRFNSRAGATVNPERTLTGLITLIVRYFLVGAALFAFIYLILAGIKYVTAGGDAAKATEARQAIINAIIGLIVISLAFVIINFATGVGNVITTQ